MAETTAHTGESQGSMSFSPHRFSAELRVFGLGWFEPQKDISTYELALLTQWFFIGTTSRWNNFTPPLAHIDWLKERGLDRHFRLEQ